jgi:hypothetical protein
MALPDRRRQKHVEQNQYLEVYRDYAGEQTAKARLPPEHAALIPVSKRQPAAAVQNQIKLICLVEC